MGAILNLLSTIDHPFVVAIDLFPGICHPLFVKVNLLALPDQLVDANNSGIGNVHSILLDISSSWFVFLGTVFHTGEDCYVFAKDSNMVQFSVYEWSI